MEICLHTIMHALFRFAATPLTVDSSRLAAGAFLLLGVRNQLVRPANELAFCCAARGVRAPLMLPHPASAGKTQLGHVAPRQHQRPVR